MLHRTRIRGALSAISATSLVLGALAVTGVALAPVSAEAHSRCWRTDSGRKVCRHRSYDHRDAAEREYDHMRAKSYDPGGSYSGYPDWARYALSPKGFR